MQARKGHLSASRISHFYTESFALSYLVFFSMLRSKDINNVAKAKEMKGTAGCPTLPDATQGKENARLLATQHDEQPNEDGLPEFFARAR